MTGSPLPKHHTAYFLAALVLTASIAVAQDWPNIGGNAARNGRVGVIGPAAADLLWSNTDDFSLISWHPFVSDGRVFTVREAGFPAGNANDALVAYDLDTGTELWRTTLPYGGDPSTEWIAWIAGARDGRVYASRASHMQPAPVLAFDAATGAPLWASAAVTQAFAYDGVVFAPDGDLLVGDWLSVLRIEETDGSTVWNAPRNCPVSGNCGVAATDTAVFYDRPVVGGHALTKLDIVTGAELYTSPTMTGFTAQNSPFLSPDGSTVYFARSQNNAATDFLYAFADSGTQMTTLWSREVRWTTSHAHGIAADGSIYTFLPGEVFARLDPNTGATLALTPPLGPISVNLSPYTAVDAQGKVYVTNGWASNPASDGRLWAFDADLSPLFTLNLNRPNQGGPALGTDGTLVVADRFAVRAYRAGGPTIGTSYCASLPTSLGAPSLISATGSTILADGDLVLTASNVPDQTGLFYFGQAMLQIPFGNGLRCVGGATVRLPVEMGAGGMLQHALDFNTPGGMTLIPGTWYFQAFFRDNPGGGSGFNLSNGLEVPFQ